MELNKELMTKAKWVSDMMAADGVCAESVTPELAIAYLDVIGRKIEKIQNIYLTQPEAREVMQNFVLAEVQ